MGVFSLDLIPEKREFVSEGGRVLHKSCEHDITSIGWTRPYKDIDKAFKEINPAAETFVELYLGELIKNEDEPQL